MKDKLQLLISDSFVYGGASAIYKFFALFTTPILADSLLSSEFGTLDSLTVLSSIVTVIIVFGLDNALARYFYDGVSIDDKKKLVSTALLCLNALAVFVLGVVYLLHEAFLNYYLPGFEDLYIVLVIILGTFFLINLRFFQNILRWTFRKKEYLILTIGPVILYFLLLLLSIYILDLGLFGVFLSLCLSNLVFSIVGVVNCASYLEFEFSGEAGKMMLAFGAPTMLTALIPALIPSIDRYYISSLEGLSFVAYYGIGQRVASLLRLPMTGVNTAVMPMFYSMYEKKEDLKSFFTSVLYGQIYLYSVVCLAILGLSDFLFSILAPPEYLVGRPVVAPLLYAALLLALSTNISLGINLSKKTYLFIFSYSIDLIVSFISIYFLSKSFGMIGAAYGVMIGKVSLLVVTTILSMKSFDLPVNLLRVLLFFSLSFGCSLAFDALQEGESYILRTTFFILIFVFFTVTSWFFLFDDHHRHKLCNVLKEV